MEGLETIRELKAEFLEIRAVYRSAYLEFLNDDTVSDYDKMTAFMENSDLHEHMDWVQEIPGMDFQFLDRHDILDNGRLMDRVLDLMNASEQLTNNDSGDMPWYLALESGSAAHVAMMYIVNNNLGSFENDW